MWLSWGGTFYTLEIGKLMFDVLLTFFCVSAVRLGKVFFLLKSISDSNDGTGDSSLDYCLLE